MLSNVLIAKSVTEERERKKKKKEFLLIPSSVFFFVCQCEKREKVCVQQTLRFHVEFVCIGQLINMFLFRRFSKSFCLIGILLSLLLFFFFFFSKYSMKDDRYPVQRDRVTKPYDFLRSLKDAERIRSSPIKIENHQLGFYVHFDLKGAAPKISYFEQLFPLLHRWGVTGICMEYEDMFPFEGIVQSIRHQQAYSKADIEKINQLAKDNDLDVMPLLQTYGKSIEYHHPSSFILL